MSISLFHSIVVAGEGERRGGERNIYIYFHCALGYIDLHQRARFIGAWIHNN